MLALSAAPINRTSRRASAEPAIDAAHLKRMTLGEQSLEAEVLAAV